MATSLTVRIYVPQSSKAVAGWSPVNRWFTMSDVLVYKKYNQKIQKYNDKYKKEIHWLTQRKNTEIQSHSPVDRWFPMPDD